MKYIEFKEDMVHGSTKFPFAYYYVNSYHPRYHMITHWHKEYEIIRILSGTFNIKIDAVSYTVKTGDILFLNSGAIHSGIPVDCTYECLVFDISSLLQQNSLVNTELNALIHYKKKIQLLFDKKLGAVYDILNQMFEIMKDKKNGYQLRIYGNLYYFLGLVEEKNLYIKEKGFSAINKKSLSRIKKVLFFIETKYMENISLEDMAKTIKMNEKYFCKFFKEITKKTPMEYLNHYRIECACEKIKFFDSSITDVAYDCGFNDTSYFTKVFKKYNSGMTPREYSKLYLKKE